MYDIGFTIILDICFILFMSCFRGGGELEEVLDSLLFIIDIKYFLDKFPDIPLESSVDSSYRFKYLKMFM